jgi:hypothetical protein
MANTVQSGSIYIDTNSAQVYSKPARVAYIIYTSSAAGDTLTLRDGDAGTDPLKITIKNPTNTNTIFFDFSKVPLRFQDGIYVSTLSTSSIATLILTSGEA